MPLPFVMVSCIIIIACVLSKLQNENSYLVGTIYSLLGIVETVSVAYLILRIVTKDDLQTIFVDSYQTMMVLFFVVLGWIYFTNLLAVVIQSCVLTSDKKFKKYSLKHWFTFTLVSIISAVTSYKFKLIISTRLFNFSCFKCQL